MKNRSQPLSIGYSPCPNDTFIFYALVHGQVDSSPVLFDQPLLEDVETLNLWALEKRLDITKLSFHALGHVIEDYCVLSAGAALGRGCGPLLVARQMVEPDELTRLRVAIPGRYTTAALLFRLFLPECIIEPVEMRFDTIMGAVQQGLVDAGVIIHESRFTYGDFGLVCLQDLGQWWEDMTGYPIPLGCIAAKRSLGAGRIEKIDSAIRESVQWGIDHPTKSGDYIRCHAQELDTEVVRSHIDLYVNDYSIDMGDEGREAVAHFIQRGRGAGALPESDIDLWCRLT